MYDDFAVDILSHRVHSLLSSIVPDLLGKALRILRRISTRFGKSRRDEVSGVNGTNGTTNASDSNGTLTNGNAAEKSTLDKRHSAFGFTTKKSKGEIVDHSASRGDVENSFVQFAQLIHASRRPLPTQSGDGAYLEPKESSGLMSDMRALGFKDVHTLMDVMKNKATGAMQDDKKYLMEKTIQVRRRLQFDSVHFLTW